MKKMQEEQQSLRVKKRRDQPIEPPRPQKLWDLSHPERKEKRQKVDLEQINTSTEVVEAKALSLTKLTFVNTVSAFKEMVELLKAEKEIAVDLEHSDLSYHGFTCLMQLSTRSEDFIVDVFPVWKEMSLLNYVFNNPSIIKVFHGAYMDMMWLHRDFDLRIAGLFDTFHGATNIGHHTKSYAYLLKHYTNVDTNK
jgi:exosome complex exonuclease RRP6